MGKHWYAKSTQRFADLPHEPCMYVAELSTGVIKIGSGSSARGRLMSLSNEVGREHSAQIARFEIFTRATYKAAYEVETQAVHMLRAVAANVEGRREYFTGVEYEDAVAIARAALVTHTKPSKVSTPRGQRTPWQPTTIPSVWVPKPTPSKSAPKATGPRKPPVDAYLADMRTGMTLAQIAKKHGKANESVIHNAMRKSGLPTCAKHALATA